MIKSTLRGAFFTLMTFSLPPGISKLSPWIGPVFCALTWGLMFCVHLSNGFSAEISLHVVETFILAWGLVCIRHIPQRLVVILVGGFTLLVFLRPATHVASTISVLPVAVIFLIYYSMGRLLSSDHKFKSAFAFALVFAGLLNTMSNLIQWLGLKQLYFWKIFFYSVEGPGGRAMGILGQSNHVGFLIVSALFLVAHCWTRRADLIDHCSYVRRWASHITWICLYVLLIFGAASTRSRTTLACAMIGTAFWIWTRRSRPAWMTATLVAFPALLLLAEWCMRTVWRTLFFADFSLNSSGPSSVKLQLLSTEHPRIGLWSHAVSIITERPWLGWGWRQTRLGLIESYPDKPHFEFFDNAHNLFLELAIYFGIPISFGLFLLLCVIAIKSKPWREARLDRQTAWLFLVCMFAYSMVEFPLWYLHFVSLAAMTAGYIWFAPRASRPQPHFFRTRYRIATTICIATMSALVFIDYQWASRAYSSSSIWPPARPGDVTTEEMFAAQSTVLFGPYTSYAIVLVPTQIKLTDKQIAFYGENVMAIQPDSALLFKLIGAHQRLGNKERAGHLLERALRQFPNDYRVTKRPVSTPASLVSHTR